MNSTHIAILALAAWTMVAHARAQSDDDYHAAMRDGSSELEAQHYPEARALFQRALGIHGDSRALTRLGQTEFELRDYVACTTHLRAALADTAHPVHGDAQQAIQSLLDRARTFVGEYRMTLDPADATITVDDQPASAPLLLAIGTHTLVVRAPGHDDLHRTIETRGGESEELTLAATVATTEPTEPEPTPAPAAAPTVHVHVTSTGRALALHRATPAGLGYDFALACAAPCDAELPDGTNTLAVSHGQSQPIVADEGFVTVREGSTVQLSYDDRDAIRVAGGVTLLAGILGGLAMIVAGAVTANGFPSGDSAALMGAGGGVMGVGLILGLALGFLGDRADIDVIAP